MALTAEVLKKLQEQGLRSLFPATTKISVGMASCGLASGAEEVFQAIQEETRKHDSRFVVTKTGCMGLCIVEPVVSVIRPGWPRIIYSEVTPEKAREIVTALSEERIIPEYALCKINEEISLIEDTTRPYPVTSLPAEMDKVPDYSQVPFFGQQQRRILQNCGLIDPESIEEYVARGGYSSLYKVLSGINPRRCYR